MKLAGNNGETVKKKPRGKPFEKGDPRINRAGAPRTGLSWAEILEEIGNLDGQQALERAGRIFAQLKKYPEGVTLKELSAISYYIRMINDPNGSLLNAVADRTDGRVKEQIDITTDNQPLKVAFDYEKLVGSIANRSIRSDNTSSESEGGLHGSAVGQDDTSGNTGVGGG